MITRWITGEKIHSPEEAAVAVVNSACAATSASISIATRDISTVCLTVVSMASNTISGNDCRLKNT